jgi:transposase
MEEHITHVGMDVHKAKIMVGYLTGGAKEPEIFEVENTPRGVGKLIRRLRSTHGEVESCYEAGPCGYALYRELKKAGIKCNVVAPSLIPKGSGDKVKTDRRDARHLAMYQRSGILHYVAVPGEAAESVRDLARLRESIQHDVVALRHRLSKQLLRNGRVYPGKAWSLAHERWMVAQRFGEEESQYVYEEDRGRLEYLLQRRDVVEKRILGLAGTERYKKDVDALRCLRGFDTLNSMMLLAELVDVRRFPDGAHLAGYLGMGCYESSSGGHEYRGSITKTGNSHARRILVEAAHPYMHRPSLTGRVKERLKDQPARTVALAWEAQQRLHKRYWCLVNKGKPHQVATVAVARELCGVICAILKAPAERFN